MSNLKDILCAQDQRARVIDDAVRLVETEVSSKGGLSGIAIKAGFKTVSAIKPGLIREAIDTLLDRFVERLEPFHEEWNTAGKSPAFDSFLTARTKKVTTALLGVTDDRARSIHNGTIKKTYEMLRPQGEKNVEAAVPGLARMMAKYVK